MKTFLYPPERINSKMAVIVNVFLVVVLIGCGVGDSSLVSAPDNTAAVSGERFVLQCTTTGNESVVRVWTVRRISDQLGQYSDPQILFSHWSDPYKTSGGFGAYVDEFGSAAMYTNSSRIEDAGLYTCDVEVKKEIFRYSAQVVILQSVPNCDFHRNGDRISMTCTVSYRGRMVPALQWKRHRQHGTTDTVGQVVSEGIQTNTVAGSNIGSTLTIVTNPSMNDFYYSCTVFFYPHNSSGSNEGASRFATNAPVFTYTWTSPVVGDQSPMTTTDGQTATAFAMGRNSADVTETNNEPRNWFVISLTMGAAMLCVFFLMAAITTVVCYRMKKRALEAEKRATIASETKPEDIQDKHLSKVILVHDDYELMPCDGYEKIGDYAADYDALNVESSGNHCPSKETGYGDLLLHNQRESTAYFAINQRDKPVQSKGETDPTYYLTLQDSPQETALDKASPADTDSPYLALTTGDVRNTDNRFSDYLAPCD